MRPTYAFTLFFVMSGWLLGACTDLDETVGMSDDGYVRFSFATSDRPVAESRAVIDDGTGKGTFEDGDEIGLYVYESGKHQYHLLDRQGGQWLPYLKREELGEIRPTLTAIYPAPQTPVEPDVHEVYCKVEKDQSGGGYQKSDVLGTQRSIAASEIGSEIQMTFQHLMHRLNITLEGLDTSAPDFAMEVYGRTQGKLDFFMEDMLLPVDNSPVEWIIPRKTGEGAFVVLLAPQPVNIGKDRIKIRCNGKDYTYKFPSSLPGGGGKNLESGKETTVTLRFTEEGDQPVDQEFANKKRWLWGVEWDGRPLPVYDESTVVYAYEGSPEAFPSGKWFYTLNGDKSTAYLSWQEGYGWYDCDKFNPELDESRPGPKDGYMCWAASASNSLHWWMYHNRDYIALYDEVYGTDSKEMVFQRPSYVFTGELGKDVFSFFRETCRDRAGYAAFGINWFITGYGYGVPYKTEEIARSFKGFFNRAFDKSDIIATTEKPLSKEKFNNIVKEALRKDLGLTFSIASTGGHAMTIWGAEFDGQGTVSALYYVDNNDYYNFEVTGSSTPYQHHRCIRKPVRYVDDRIYLGATGRVYIMDVGKVDLRRDVWEKWKQSLNNKTSINQQQ